MSACGAGAGGFLVCVLAPTYTQQDLQQAVGDLNREGMGDGCLLSVHTVSVESRGLLCGSLD
jgi:hypothetical protein